MTFRWKTELVLAFLLVMTAGLAIAFRDIFLLHAIKFGSLGISRVLVFLGANVNAEDGAPMERIPLHWAIYNHQKDISLFLLEKGALVHCKDSNRFTALDLAAIGTDQYGFKDGFQLMKKLLKLGADINTRDEFGGTILMRACGRKVVEFLLENGADPNAKDHTGKNVLYQCINSDAVPILLQHGADATNLDTNGQTAIFSIVHKTSGPVGEPILTNVELLIKAGLNPRAKDRWGRSAITGALEEGMDDLVALLERHGGGVEMTPELEAAREHELAGMLFRRMHSLPRATGCQVTLRNGEQMAEPGRQIFGVKGETVEAWGECPSGGVLHGVVFGNGKVFKEFMNLSPGMGGFKPLNGTQGPVAFTLVPEMRQTEAAWILTERPAASMRQALTQASAALASKHSVMVGRRGN